VNDDLISAILISIVGLALIYYACYHIFRMPKRISIVIASSFTLLTYLFLLSNPQVLDNTWEKIALIIIASVIGVAALIRKSV